MSKIKLITYLVCFVMLWAECRGTESILRDAEVEAALKALAIPLMKQLQVNPDDVNLYAIIDDNIDSFSVGNNIFITTSALTIRDIDLISGLLAYEIVYIAKQKDSIVLIQNAKWQSLLINQTGLLNSAVYKNNITVPVIDALDTSKKGGLNAKDVLKVVKILQTANRDPLPWLNFATSDTQYSSQRSLTKDILKNAQGDIQNSTISVQHSEDDKIYRVRAKILGFLELPYIKITSESDEFYKTYYELYKALSMSKYEESLSIATSLQLTNDQYIKEVIAYLTYKLGNANKAAYIIANENIHSYGTIQDNQLFLTEFIFYMLHSNADIDTYNNILQRLIGMIRYSADVSFLMSISDLYQKVSNTGMSLLIKAKIYNILNFQKLSCQEMKKVNKITQSNVGEMVYTDVTMLNELNNLCRKSRLDFAITN